MELIAYAIIVIAIIWMLGKAIADTQETTRLRQMNYNLQNEVERLRSANTRYCELLQDRNQEIAELKTKAGS